ncbi:MAG TPA: hypothetical protein VEP90_12925 [Methylomirabilota bacterium]|nr:hypothetical protein [Methylomirabilota bacterium]
MNYTLTLTETEMLILSEALGDLPFKKSSVLIGKLQQQVNDQNKEQSVV